jgi:hypothetical protein
MGKIKASALRLGMIFVEPAMPSASTPGGRFEVLAVSAPYASPNGHSPSTYVRLKLRDTATGAERSNPYLADAELTLA